MKTETINYAPETLPIGLFYLHTLAQHLRHGRLGHKHFDLTVYNNGEIDKGGCGTRGCAIGELPIVWPNYFSFDMFRPHLYGPDGNFKDLTRIVNFFEITEKEYGHLFLPENQNESLPAIHLPYNAPKEDVAKNIELFIEHKLKIKSKEN